MSIKEFNHGIKVMKWNRSYRGERAWVFAKAWTFRGFIILKLKGYRRHYTIFGWVMRKDL